MRTDRLLRIAIEAEILRQRRRLRRLVIRAVMAAVAAVFLFGALCWFEVATWFWVHLNLGRIGSTLIVVGGNLLMAMLLLLAGYALWRRPDRIEREALEVRARAQGQLESIASFATAFAGPAGRLLRRSRPLSLLAAILLPRFLMRRRRR